MRRLADAYRTFALASARSGNDTCTAGLLTQLGSAGTCGVHPSYAGQALLAQIRRLRGRSPPAE
ncbi:MAG: hypothetical protein ACLPZR_11545 [Solirubrobacteraceae bacterium]